ncbi:MAG: arginine--tRNA ligase [Pseudomonadota bacterium]
MKQEIINLISEALSTLPLPDGVTADALPTPELTRTRDAEFGDFASNIAMQLARTLKRSPRDIANDIVTALPTSELISKAEVAGPGFINLFLNESSANAVVADVLRQGSAFGQTKATSPERILIEYVSANPTGPLHVGHGRHAAYGATLANLLRATGHEVSEEYYVNDAGRQMDILAASVLVRAVGDEDTAFPFAGYRGGYIRDIARDWKEAAGSTADVSIATLYDDLPEDGEDDRKEAFIDALIARAENLLGEQFATLRTFAKDAILDDIRDDLAEFGVTPERFFSEQSLEDDGSTDAAIKTLTDNGTLYEKGGALWFKTSDYGDEKDRVVVRENGKKTYFASDIGYHLNKRNRGFDRLIDVWGSDHHGYIARVEAGMTAMGVEADSLEVRLVQFVSLYRGGVKAQMGTRSGNFVTLRALREEVGNDAARLFYIMRSNDQHLDFDLELATSKRNENPVYYLQYAHARISNVFEKLDVENWTSDNGLKQLARLTESHEQALLSQLARYPEAIQSAANKRAPNALINYLRDLATDLHSYYNAHKFMVDDPDLRDARLTLILAVQQVLKNGFSILGISAPDRM